MLAKGKDEVLSRNAAGLGACEEKCENLVNDTLSAVLKKPIYQQNSHEVTRLCKFWVGLYCSTSLVYDDLAKVTQSLRIECLVSFKRCDVVLGENREEYDVRLSYTIDQV